MCRRALCRRHHDEAGDALGGACGAGKCQIATPTRAVVAHADPFLSLFLIAQMAGYLGSTWTWRVVP